MEVKFLNFIRGYVRIRFWGTSYDRFLNLCAFHKIILWDLVPSGEGYEAYLTKKDFRRLRGIVRKSHASVRITERHGLPFFVHKYRKRKFYVLGIAAAVLFMIWLSSRIWEISIDGNLSQTDDIIFEYLTEAGIVHGMKKSDVDCQELSSGIRDYFTEFSWVTAELKGTRLLIHVKEGILPGVEEESSEPADLIASEDGTVESIYVRSGVPAVKAGDTVKKGDLLVSGAIPIYEDSGEIRSYQYVAPDADLVIRTSVAYEDSFSLAYQQKNYTGKERIQHLLTLGTLSFSLPGPGSSYENSDFLTETRQLKLFENFYLPVYIKKITEKEYYYSDNIYTKTQAEEIASAHFHEFMKNLEEKGVQIFENDVKINWNENFCIVSGTVWIGKNASVPRAIQETQEEELLNEHG